MLLTLAQANARIERGAPLIIAGARTALKGLKRGNWIGGSIPYFMTADGVRCDRQQVYVDEINLPASKSKIECYSASQLRRLATDAYENGFTYVIIPANSAAHLEYAMHAPTYPEVFLKPIIGWISGVHLDDLATDAPIVIDGRTGKLHPADAIALHVELPPDCQPMVQTVNLFRPGSGPALSFREAGFSATDVIVDGRPTPFARYLKDRAWIPSLPLVADYAGTHVNVSIKAIDEPSGRVSFYAPVFPNVIYREPAPIGDYVEAFAKQVPADVKPILSCNCILNYLYGKLESRRTGAFTGPVTFGEIAHQLLNQTLVYLVDSKNVS